MTKTHEFGLHSERQLKSCHEELQLIARETLKASDIDFKIVEGHRSVERQKRLYDERKSRVDGVKKKGKHNYDPSLAFDICVSVYGVHAYHRESLTFLAGVLTSVAKTLYDNGKILHILRWGGNWDRDETILADQTFMDLPHFELYDPK